MDSSPEAFHSSSSCKGRQLSRCVFGQGTGEQYLIPLTTVFLEQVVLTGVSRLFSTGSFLNTGPRLPGSHQEADGFSDNEAKPGSVPLPEF